MLQMYTPDQNQLTKKKKNSKTINGLPKELFTRLQFIGICEEDSTELTLDTTILESYVPRVLNSCSTPSRTPHDPLDVKGFKCSIRIPSQKPFFHHPKLPQRLPSGDKRKVIVEPKYPSIIPLLITAKSAGIDTRGYHVVSQRNALRKLAMNDENFVVNIVRFDSTLYLRRFAEYRSKDRNNVGFWFEEMCTDKSKEHFDFNQLVDGRIGEYKILMMGEVDTIKKENGESIELKCKKQNATAQDKADWWLQAFLIGTKTIIHGRRSYGDETIISHLQEHDTESLLDRGKKMTMLNRLRCALRFLFSNVAPERTYLLRGYKDETGQRQMGLFEVIDPIDKKKLSFITHKLIDMFAVDEAE